jgi:putative membrane protein
MTKGTRLVALFALAVGVMASRAEDPKDKQPFDDTVFVKTAASAGLHEVELGKIASEKAKNEDIKKFAQQMVTDHTKANEELKAAAKAARIEVPEKMNETHQKHVDTFKNYKGTDFDADYLKHTVTDHNDSVALFTRASKEAKNPQLRDFATKTLPTIQKHLEMAKKLQK